jgi:hypothetical protein
MFTKTLGYLYCVLCITATPSPVETGSVIPTSFQEGIPEEIKPAEATRESITNEDLKDIIGDSTVLTPVSQNLRPEVCFNN